MLRRRHALLASGALAVLAACTADGAGALDLRISGEQGALEGFPHRPVGNHDHDHGNGGEHADQQVAFADGWSLRFTKYLVAVGDIELETADGDLHRDDAIYVADLTRGEPVFVGYPELSARRWDGFSFSVRPPTDADQVIPVDGAQPEDVSRLVDGKFNYWIEGHASKGDREVTFAWGLDNPVRNTDCTNGVDGTQGIVVRNNRTTTAEITIHVEHLFWHSLGAEQTDLRFDAIAAVAGADGDISWDALATQLLSDLRDADGERLLDAEGNPLIYNPASTGAQNLQNFILEATRTQAHLSGTGLCRPEPR